MELAKVFVMTRDEYDLIEDFLLYHGNIFGFHNLVVIDNNSKDPRVLQVYEKYRRRGVTILSEPNYKAGGQGQAFTKHMLAHQDQCQFLIGLDTDEFMVFQSWMDSGRAPTLLEAADAIRSYLQSMPSDISISQVDTYYGSDVDASHTDYVDQKMQTPARFLTTFRKDRTCKQFYRAAAFVSTDNGNHSGAVKCGRTVTETVLAYVHMHNTGMRRMFERARLVMDGYKYTDVAASPAEQMDQLRLIMGQPVAGTHRVEQYVDFLMADHIYDMFLRHVKRLPEQEELRCHARAHRNCTLEAVEKEFANCAEALSRADLPPLEALPGHKSSMVYYDPPLRPDALHWSGLHDMLSNVE